MQAHGFRFSFTPLSAVLFTFPSRYLSTIGLPGVLSLGGWCRRIRTGLLRPRPTQGPGRVRDGSAYGAVTLCGAPFQAPSATVVSSLAPALQPRARLDARGLGWPPFARRYSGGHSCFPFLRLLGCFGSAGSPPPPVGAAPSRGGFPHSGIRGSLAARASPRPFAACRALPRLREPQASPVRPLSLATPAGRPHGQRPRSSLVFSLSLRSGRVASRRPHRRVFLPSCQRTPAAPGRGNVENAGLEPATPGLQSRCSSRLSQSPLPCGSPGQTRTADPHIISVVL